MFSNVGKKIKILAWIVFVAGIAYSLYLGLTTIFGFGGTDNLSSTLSLISGLLTIFAGIISSGITMLLLYGFGELIDKTCATYNEIHLLKRLYFAKNEEFLNLKSHKCPKCGNSVVLGDSKCQNCGIEIEW